MKLDYLALVVLAGITLLSVLILAILERPIPGVLEVVTPLLVGAATGAALPKRSTL